MELVTVTYSWPFVNKVCSMLLKKTVIIWVLMEFISHNIKGGLYCMPALHCDANVSLDVLLEWKEVVNGNWSQDNCIYGQTEL